MPKQAQPKSKLPDSTISGETAAKVLAISRHADLYSLLWEYADLKAFPYPETDSCSERARTFVRYTKLFEMDNSEIEPIANLLARQVETRNSSR